MSEVAKRRLVWLASYPKSGNTWMRMLLAAYQHNRVVEFELTDAYRATMSASRRNEFERITGQSELSTLEIDQARQRVQEDIAKRVRPPVLLKTHDARMRHNGYPLIRNELTLGAIYVVRNPLDVVDSFADHMGLSIDRAIAKMNHPGYTIGGPHESLVKQHLSTWSEHVCSWCNQREFPVHLVRYEDLKTHLTPTLRNILTFLGWPIDCDRLDYAVKQTQFSKLQQKEDSDGFSERSNKSKGGRFFRQGRSGHWRENLTRKQIDLIVHDHRETMGEMGYLSSDDSPQGVEELSQPFAETTHSIR
ncbi:MAG: sulfotransferase domain-containing protein [Planctomycetota bacterium]